MKTSFLKNNFILSVIFSTVSLGFLAGCSDDDEPLMTNYNVSGNAAGSQVVPSVAGTGTATMTGTYNPNSRVLTYNSTWTGLTGAPNGGGFYNGASGVAGTAVGTPWTFDAGATGTGSRTGTMTLTESEGNQLVAGNWYYGYGTGTNAAGEVRGQMTATR